MVKAGRFWVFTEVWIGSICRFSIPDLFRSMSRHNSSLRKAGAAPAAARKAAGTVPSASSTLSSPRGDSGTRQAGKSQMYRKRDTGSEKGIAGQISEKAMESTNQARLRIAFPLCSTTRCLLPLSVDASDAAVYRLLTNCFTPLQ